MGSTGSRYEPELSETSRLDRAAADISANSDALVPAYLDRNDNNQKIFDELKAIVGENHISAETNVDDKEGEGEIQNTEGKTVTEEDEYGKRSSNFLAHSAADRYLVTNLEKRQDDATTIQQCIIQGQFELTRFKLQQMYRQNEVNMTVIDRKRAYLLDRGGPNLLPVAIVQKQSAVPCLVSHFTRTNKRSTSASRRRGNRLPNLNIAASESDSLLSSH